MNTVEKMTWKLYAATTILAATGIILLSWSVHANQYVSTDGLGGAFSTLLLGFVQTFPPRNR